MLIPFVLTPAIGLIIGYAATAMHFMNECVVYIPWTTPPLLSGYLATAGGLESNYRSVGYPGVGDSSVYPLRKNE